MAKLTDEAKRNVLFAICGLSVVTGVLVALTPKDEKLGVMLRFVLFHGASTWVNMATFTLAGLLGLAFIVRGDQRLYSWASSFRYMALPHWLANTLMGLYSMKVIWGDILWKEPRLQMSFWFLFGAMGILAVDLALEKPKITAALDGVLAATLWMLVVTTPKLFHPDSPVLKSESVIKYYFFAQAACLLVIAVLAALLFTARAKAPEADAEGKAA